MISVKMQQRIFFATSHGKSAVDGVGGTTSITLNQLYLILFTSTNLCLRKKLGKCYEKGGIVPGTRSCHQFCPLSSDKTAYKR